jgi:hypothetical protein
VAFFEGGEWEAGTFDAKEGKVVKTHTYTMKMKTCMRAVALVGALGVAHCASAQDNSSTNSFDNANISMDEIYRKQEIDVDLFGSGALGQQTLEHTPDFRRHTAWGGGGGVTAYFFRYLGVGGEYNIDTRNSHFSDNAGGNIYLRLPIFHTGLAPYIFGGGGYQFQNVRQSYEDGGAGLEFRFCKNIGIFVDGRWVFSEHTSDSALARAGVRFSF